MSDASTPQTTDRRPGTIGTSDRFKDAAGQLWKKTRKGWRLAAIAQKPKGKTP